MGLGARVGPGLPSLPMAPPSEYVVRLRVALGLSGWFAICIHAGILSSVGVLRRNWMKVSTLSGNGKSDLCLLTWSEADNNICVLVRARETILLKRW